MPNTKCPILTPILTPIYTSVYTSILTPIYKNLAYTIYKYCCVSI